MKPKTRRLWLVVISLLCVSGALAIILAVFRDNLVFFYTPSELSRLKNTSVSPPRIRAGGLVKQGSVRAQPYGKHEPCMEFELTDLAESVAVSYCGMKPPMFREGQGVVAEGLWMGDVKELRAQQLLTKHDENYMPPEVAEALKKSGQWKGGQNAPEK